MDYIFCHQVELSALLACFCISIARVDLDGVTLGHIVALHRVWCNEREAFRVMVVLDQVLFLAAFVRDLSRDRVNREELICCDVVDYLMF